MFLQNINEVAPLFKCGLALLKRFDKILEFHKYINVALHESTY